MFRHSVLLFFLLPLLGSQPLEKTMSSKTKIAIAIHGGASNIQKMNLTPEEEQAYMATLSAALDSGYVILKRGGSSVEATVAAVRVMEDSPLFNAGRGSVIAHDGAIEMDAAIMDGATLRCGAIAGARTIRNPITAARKIMENGQFILLAGEGADAFARDNGIETVDTSYFFTPFRIEQWEKARHKAGTQLDNESRGSINPVDELEVEKFGTVGCVALDAMGNLAAATSTGGLVNKQYHRVGDSPLIGAGTYADNQTCAVSCTGKGEDFIRLVVAHNIASRMRYEQISLRKAARNTIQKDLKNAGGRGGCIAIDCEGHITMPFTTSGMFRGKIGTNGKKTVEIYKSVKKKTEEIAPK